MHAIERILADLNGADFIGIDTMADVKLNKTLNGDRKQINPHFGRVTKKVTGSNVMVSTNKNGSVYERMVNRRLAQEGKEGGFEVQQRKWGTRIGTTPFIEHGEKKYLEVFFLHAGETEYFLDGVKIEKSDILGLPAASSTEEQQGGLENQVIIRTISFDSIRTIVCNKHIHVF